MIQNKIQIVKIIPFNMDKAYIINHLPVFLKREYKDRFIGSDESETFLDSEYVRCWGWYEDPLFENIDIISVIICTEESLLKDEYYMYDANEVKFNSLIAEYYENLKERN